MNGLDRYIRKHGKHFTEKLAYKVAGRRWSGRQIEKAAQRKVYYNVTGSTLGDMIYLTNEASNRWNIPILYTCAKFTLYRIGNHQYYGGVVFDDWLEDLENINPTFDFTPYI
jgi:hypothetical protein